VCRDVIGPAQSSAAPDRRPRIAAANGVLGGDHSVMMPRGANKTGRFDLVHVASFGGAGGTKMRRRAPLVCTALTCAVASGRNSVFSFLARPI